SGCPVNRKAIASDGTPASGRPVGRAGFTLPAQARPRQGTEPRSLQPRARVAIAAGSSPPSRSGRPCRPEPRAGRCRTAGAVGHRPPARARPAPRPTSRPARAGPPSRPSTRPDRMCPGGPAHRHFACDRNPESKDPVSYRRPRTPAMPVPLDRPHGAGESVQVVERIRDVEVPEGVSDRNLHRLLGWIGLLAFGFATSGTAGAVALHSGWLIATASATAATGVACLIGRRLVDLGR